VARAQVDSSAAAIPRAEASVTVAEVALEDTLLVSPFDGVVTVKNSEIGEIVAPVSVGSAARGNSVVEIADMGSLEAEVDINETHISRVREGQPARIILDAFPDRPYPGILRQIVPTANRQKATIEAKVAFTEKGPEVLPEMSARVTFMEEGTPAAAGGRPRVFISHRAVASRGGGPVVLVVRAGRVSVVSIELGPDVEGQVEVLEGLSGGESLVLEPDDSIADGDKVRIRAAS
jgi:RND family efflux transporter MFP subunit